jgi:hypothetical protein
MKSDLATFAAHLCDRISRNTGRGVAALQPDFISDPEFNRLALELFSFQFANNEAFHRLCAARGIAPGKVAHWSGIPAVPTAAFKEFELSCLAPSERTAVFHSSGTTGQRPSRHFHSPGSLKLYEASLWAWFQSHVLAGLTARAGEWRLAVLTPASRQVPHSSLAHMFETVRGRVGADENAFLGAVESDGSWSLDVSRTESTLRDAVATGQPLALLGTAFAFVHLVDALVERGLHFNLPPGSIVMETGGYKGRSRELPKTDLHNLIGRCLGVGAAQILCEYGMSELSSQAYDGVAGDAEGARRSRPASRHFNFPPWCRVRIVSPETGREVAVGETGLIRVFDLANAFSILAVQTEDLAIRHADGVELLGRASAAEARGCSLMASEVRSP